MSKYSCAMCVNLGSPLCKICTKVLLPSGKEAPPKYFTAMTSVSLSPRDDTRSSIVKCVLDGHSVPLEWVRRYNQSVAPDVPDEK